MAGDTIAEMARKTSLADRIRGAREKAKLSQTGLAKKVKVSRGAVGQWEAGLHEPTRENLKKIADVTGERYEYLATGEGGSVEESTTIEQGGMSSGSFATSVTVRELDARGGMGGGGLIESEIRRDGSYADPLKPEPWIFPPAYLREIHASASRLLVIECQGDSMHPTIQSGERVVIDTGHTKPSPDGIYALRDQFDLVVIKRLQVHQDKPRIRIISDNPSHAPEDVGLDEITIVGRVVCCLKRL